MGGSAAQDRLRLLTQVEFLEQVFIPVRVRLAEVIEQAPAHRDHLEEAPARGMIFGVGLQVFRQMSDPAGEECHLHIRAAGILLMKLECREIHRVAAFCHNEVRSVGEECRLASCAAYLKRGASR